TIAIEDIDVAVAGRGQRSVPKIRPVVDGIVIGKDGVAIVDGDGVAIIGGDGLTIIDEDGFAIIDGNGVGVGATVSGLMPAFPISTEPSGIPVRGAPPGAVGNVAAAP